MPSKLQIAYFLLLFPSILEVVDGWGALQEAGVIPLKVTKISIDKIADLAQYFRG